ncbi:ABC transporter substrate-binding protein [Bacillus sp. 7884-1]|uniref:ABC transporter substrate-binding protein n=1 Tax=Bacillus sp. 7884-1 TaxID=2021693 RepID=UPI000BA5F18F|nr:sugar ABC transporter substrate-binding protein [Bacillus sp. 7884-1]PAE32936.1 sugar ABC transporter substrate-binding protein [Bacillus sp. 7884-1]
MKIRRLLVLSIIALLVFALAGCSSSKNSDEANGKTVINYFSFSATPDHETQLNEMIKAFEAKNPNIKVKTELAAYNDYFTKLQTRIAGGKAPDVFELNYENFVEYASKGTLVDLSGYIKDDKDFKPEQLNQQAFKAYQYDGKQYGMVESFSNVLTFYNKDLFDQAGVAYPTADWKWADELDAAKKLTDKNNKVWGTFAPVTMNEFFKIAAQNGGQIFDNDGNIAINSPENLEALNYMVDKVTKDQISPTPADLSGQSPEDLFKSGKLAILHTGIWMFDAFKDLPFKWDVQLEAGNTKQAHHFFANGLAVSKDSKQKEAAYKFASFMSASEEVAKIRVDSAWELPAITNQDILNPYLEKNPPQNRKAVFEALDSLVLPPVVENWSKISDATNKQFEQALNGEKSTKEVLESLESEYKQILNK